MVSSSYTNMIPGKKYDVFLSFRGEDTRANLTSHLKAALSRKGIEAFVDDQLNKGDEISQSLLTAIEASSISVIIFSERYASSGWCLDELVKILGCKNKDGQVVIPVFYRVDPSDVRKQTGTFGESFSDLEERFRGRGRLDKLLKWRSALRDAANLSGFDSRVIRLESELVEKITDEILKRMEHLFSSDYKDQLIGLEPTIVEIESLLNIEKKIVYKLGIWGIGGIGKTTIATAVFKKISSDFEVSCFIENVGEESEKAGGLAQWQRKLLSRLLKNENAENIDISNIGFYLRRLSRKKALVVFDDVTHLEQIEFSFRSFRVGSRIIITTRDRHVLDLCRADGVHEVRELRHDDALKLFCRHAFGKNGPNGGYEQLSGKVIEYIQGVPLALKVLGCFLFERSQDEWISAINKLKKGPHMDIQKVLKVSYDSLDGEERNIFLDIACFFKGKDEDLVTKFLDASGFSAKIGIKVLIDKCLVTISNNMITMHDLVQEMGREIVRQESVRYPGKRSRLWDHEEIYEVLKYNTVTEAIEGISLDMSKVESICLHPDCFSKMYKLRFINFYGGNINKVHIRDTEPFLMGYLSHLHWPGYPLKSLPVHPEKLVSLQMVRSEVEQLWDGVQNLVNLVKIDLSFSRQLTKLPDLSKAQNLQNLIFQHCSRLVEIHPSIEYLNKLVNLDLMNCTSLTSLPRRIRSKYLQNLHLYGCSNLKMLSEISSSLKKFNLGATGIEELPSSFDCQSKLEGLYLPSCSRLKGLPSSLLTLESLEDLTITGCSNLKRLPEFSCCNLKYLHFGSSAIEELPPSIERLSRLISLDLENCSRLLSLPSSLCKLKSLKYLTLSGCSNLERLPDELGNLDSLTTLRFERTAIIEVPPSIVRLKNLVKLHLEEFWGHEQLSSILPILLSSEGLHNLESLKLIDCGITELPESLGQLSSLRDLLLDKNNFGRIPESVINLRNLKKLHLNYCERLQSLPNLPCSLEYMDANHCSSLQVLSGLSILFSIHMSRQEFSLRNCFKLDVDELQKIFENALHKIQIVATARSKRQRKSYLVDGDCESTICCPGKEIPEWFRYQGIGSSLALELPPGDRFNNEILGFAYCVVVAFEDHHKSEKDFRVDFRYILKTENGGESGVSFKSIGYSEKDQVFFGFGVFDPFPDKIFPNIYNSVASFKFNVRVNSEGIECCEVVKKCGVHLLWAQDCGESKKDGSTSSSSCEEEGPHTKRLKYTTSSL